MGWGRHSYQNGTPDGDANGLGASFPTKMEPQTGYAVGVLPQPKKQQKNHLYNFTCKTLVLISDALGEKIIQVVQ